MKNRNIEIGKRIKQKREELGLTQEELGTALGFNKSTIQRYENGKIANIKLPIIHAMAKQLNVNPNWLVLKTEEMGHFVWQNELDENGENIEPQKIITEVDINKARITALFDNLTITQQENIIGRAEMLVEQNKSNISVDTTNKTYTSRVAAFGGNNKVYQISEEQVGRAMDILREDEENEE